MLEIPKRVWYRSINVVIGPVPESDQVLFGILPITNGWDELYYLESVANLPALLREVGIFKSSSEAINHGHKGPVPPGYTELKFKGYKYLYILNHPIDSNANV